MTVANEIDFLRNGGETRRFHTWPVLRQQNVAEHSYGVAWLCVLIAEDGNTHTGGLTVNLMLAALAHDAPEWKTGDMPAPTKRFIPGGREAFAAMERKELEAVGLPDYEATLSPWERMVLKLADNMEGCFYCIRERAMGNKLIVVPFMNFRNYVRDVVVEADESDIPKTAWALLDHIDEMWEQANG